MQKKSACPCTSSDSLKEKKNVIRDQLFISISHKHSKVNNLNTNISFFLCRLFECILFCLFLATTYNSIKQRQQQQAVETAAAATSIICIQKATSYDAG